MSSNLRQIWIKLIGWAEKFWGLKTLRAGWREGLGSMYLCLQFSVLLCGVMWRGTPVITISFRCLSYIEVGYNPDFYGNRRFGTFQTDSLLLGTTILLLSSIKSIFSKDLQACSISHCYFTAYAWHFMTCRDLQTWSWKLINANDLLLLEKCSQHGLVIINTVFQQADKYKTSRIPDPCSGTCWTTLLSRRRISMMSSWLN